MEIKVTISESDLLHEEDGEFDSFFDAECANLKAVVQSLRAKYREARG